MPASMGMLHGLPSAKATRNFRQHKRVSGANCCRAVSWTPCHTCVSRGQTCPSRGPPEQHRTASTYTKLVATIVENENSGWLTAGRPKVAATLPCPPINRVLKKPEASLPSNFITRAASCGMARALAMLVALVATGIHLGSCTSGVRVAEWLGTPSRLHGAVKKVGTVALGHHTGLLACESNLLKWPFHMQEGMVPRAEWDPREFDLARVLLTLRR